MDGAAWGTRCSQGWIPRQGQDGTDDDGTDGSSLRSCRGGTLKYSLQGWFSYALHVCGDHNHQWECLFHCCRTSSIEQKINYRRQLVYLKSEETDGG